MPSNSTGQIAIWQRAVAEVAFSLSNQDTGVRVSRIPAPHTTVNLPPVAPSSFPNDGDTYTILDEDGSCGAGTEIVIVPPTGTTIRGAASFALSTAFASALVTFDGTSKDWTVESDEGGAEGAGTTTIRIPIALVSVASATAIPAGALVDNVKLHITTPYSIGATIALGQAGAVAEFMGTGDNNPQLADLYLNELDAIAASTNPLLVTIAGAPAAGAGFAIVQYTASPNN